jgi:hypothetical protein
VLTTYGVKILIGDLEKHPDSIHVYRIVLCRKLRESRQFGSISIAQTLSSLSFANQYGYFLYRIGDSLERGSFIPKNSKSQVF